MLTYTELDTLPEWRQYTPSVRGTETDPALPPLWSGELPPPRVGDDIPLFYDDRQIVGTVKGYFTEHGFLGVRVLPSRRPSWWDAGIGPYAHLFGTEIDRHAGAAGERE